MLNQSAGRFEEAWVLKLYPFGEADAVVVCLAKYSGKLRLVAKGLKRIKNRQHGILSPFNRVSILAEGGAGEQLGRLLDAHLDRGIQLSSGRLAGYYFLSYLAEIILHMEIDPVAGEKFFRLVDALFNLAISRPVGAEHILYLQYWILQLEGLAADPARCQGCGLPFDAGHRPYHHHPGRSAFSCRPFAPSRTIPEESPLRAEELQEILQFYRRNPPDKIGGASKNIFMYILEYDRLLSDFIGVRFKSFALLTGELQSAAIDPPGES